MQINAVVLSYWILTETEGVTIDWMNSSIENDLLFVHRYTFKTLTLKSTRQSIACKIKLLSLCYNINIQSVSFAFNYVVQINVF